MVDPKRRVRQASQECVAILAAFMGPSKAAPLIRSIELLESHFERGTGVLNAVQARLSRRQLPRITQDGLVEYSLQVPRSAVPNKNGHSANGPRGRSESPVHGRKYGADVDWILAGTFFRSKLICLSLFYKCRLSPLLQFNECYLWFSFRSTATLILKNRIQLIFLSHVF